MLRDFALREGDPGKAKAWEIIAHSRWRRLKGETTEMLEGAENAPARDLTVSSSERGHPESLNFQVEGGLAVEFRTNQPSPEVAATATEQPDGEVQAGPGA